jgi:hypothetical protein
MVDLNFMQGTKFTDDDFFHGEGHLGAWVRRGTGRGEIGDLVCVLTGHADEELQLEFDRRSAMSSNRGGSWNLISGPRRAPTGAAWDFL